MKLQIIFGIIFFSILFKSTLTFANDYCDRSLKNFLISPENPIQLRTLDHDTSFIYGAEILTRHQEFQDLAASPKEWEELIDSYVEDLKLKVMDSREADWQPRIELVTETSWYDPYDNYDPYENYHHYLAAVYPYDSATLKINYSCLLCNYFEVTLVHELTHLLTFKAISRNWPHFQWINWKRPGFGKTFIAYTEIISDIISLYYTDGVGDEIALSLVEENTVSASVIKNKHYRESLAAPRYRFRDLTVEHRSEDFFKFLKYENFKFTEIFPNILIAKARSYIWLRLRNLSPQLSLKEVFDLLIDTTVVKTIDQYKNGDLLTSDKVSLLTLENVSDINDGFINTFENHLSNLLEKKRQAALSPPLNKSF